MTYRITDEDIATIERLYGKTLDEAIKGYLLGQYGRGGQNEWYENRVVHCSGGDLFLCASCQACLWDTGDPLLLQIALAILCYERGRLDVEHGNHHGVLGEVSLTWRFHDDPDCPF